MRTPLSRVDPAATFRVLRAARAGAETAAHAWAQDGLTVQRWAAPG